MLDCAASFVWKRSGVIIADEIPEQSRRVFPCSHLTPGGVKVVEWSNYDGEKLGEAIAGAVLITLISTVVVSLVS